LRIIVIVKYNLKNLSILHYPDPRLRARCQTVTKFDENLEALAGRMIELMHSAAGVGLAAPQVGVLIRLFVMQPPGEGQAVQAYVNPVIRAREGSTEAEEGCLCLPGVDVRVRRSKRCRLEAQDLKGNPVELEGEDMVCRIWQHETDHLDGVLIIDRMGPSDQMATRKTLRALEASYTDGRKSPVS
jgi:peptide deformylase